MIRETFSLRGLSDKEAEASRRRYGANTLTEKKPRSFFQKYRDSFRDPIIRVLLFSLILNLIFVIRNGNWQESIGIAAAVFLSTFVSTLSEHSSERAFRRLKESAAQDLCRVVRGGSVRQIPIYDVVVGDRIHLAAGERVPADALLIGGSLTVDQSALNGESRDQKKEAAAMAALPDPEGIHWDLSEPCQVFRGSLITAGDAEAVVGRVGDHTFYGTMARELQTEGRDSPLKLRLTRLASTLSRIGYLAAVLVAASDLVRSFLILRDVSSWQAVVGHLLHAMTLGITIVVVAVPEGLPMMITVVLSSRMFRMMREGVMVRKPVGIETAGSMTLLFTDKTGTLTRGNAAVSGFMTADGTFFDRAASLPLPLRRLTELSAFFNTGATFDKTDVFGGNATERALLSFCLPHRLNPADFCRTAYLPFDSSYKYSAASLKENGGETLYLIKGAPEKILAACTHCIGADGARIPQTDHGVLEAKIERLTEKSARVLALALSPVPITSGSDFSSLALIGVAVIRDAVRREARSSVRGLREAGIQTVMITGDNRLTAAAVAKECGILSSSVPEEGRFSVLTGDELAALSDEQIRLHLSELRVIARALPSDKSRLVRLAQENEAVVGMTGDGINDAPALKAADVGFAMGSGTDVAKEAGDIVITDDNIASIARAVGYGRTIFHSIRKFIVFQLTMNFCAVCVSILGPLIGIDTPVTVMQMLWINLIMDTLAGLAFAGEPPRRAYMKEPPKSRTEPVLDRAMAVQILSMGCYTVALCAVFLTSQRMRAIFRPSEGDLPFLCGFFTLFVFCGIFNSFNARTASLWPLAGLGRNKPFLIIMTAVSLIQLILTFCGSPLFRMVPLTLHETMLILMLSFTVIPADQIIKVFLRLSKK